jgi:hypothetical protein
MYIACNRIFCYANVTYNTTLQFICVISISNSMAIDFNVPRGIYDWRINTTSPFLPRISKKVTKIKDQKHSHVRYTAIRRVMPAVGITL